MQSSSSEKYTLNTVLLGLGALVGVVGNVCVILMYNCKMKKRRDDRYFIPWLALVNLFATIIAVTFFITLNSLHANYTSDILCKSLNYFNRVTFVISLVILLVIAIQRYKKICNTFGNRISLFWKRFSIVFTIIASSLISIPMAIFYGVTEVLNTDTNVTEFRCQLRSEAETNSYARYGLYVFHGCVFSLIFIIVTSITSLYLIIGRRIHSNMQTPSKTLSSSTSSLFSNSINQTDIVLRKARSETNMFKVKSKQNSENSTPTLVIYSGSGVQVGRSQSTNNCRKIHKRRNLNIYRYSYMFFTISVVTFVSYVPPFIVILLETADRDLWNDLSYTQLNILLLFRRMYLLSYVINPFLFGLFDRTFRSELKAVIMFIVRRKWNLL